ncbi:MAG TPA: hypothetical protein VHE30_02380 [Polyangiaceae bacterium]|nr:hypothetical protein [Polyangiaceae bacterium]
MKILDKSIAVLCLAFPLAAAADPLPKPVSDMECLVGSWKGGGAVTMGKDHANIAATWTCKRTSSKFGLSCSFQVTGIPGVPLYDETDLMGYEPNTNLYHWYSVTNAGETHDHVAKVPAGNKLEFVFDGTQEGKPFKEVIDLEFSKDEKTVSGRAETFVAGVSTSVMSLSLRK